MKYITLIAFALLTFTTLTGAQTGAKAAPTTTVPPAKIAVVFPGLFADEKEGITKFLAAIRQLNTEFAPKQQELEGLQKRIQTLSDEFQKLNAAKASEATLRTKQEEYERLMREFEFKKKEAESAYQKRQAALMTPISQEIDKSLQAFADAEGITMILDGEKLGESLLTMMPTIDVTRAFIKYFNSKSVAR